MHPRFAPFVVILLISAPSSAQTPLGTAFTYQGQLKNAGSQASGSFDIQFALFDAASGGNQIGPTICSDNVNISNGLFTVSLDFGAPGLDGNQRFLEISVRADSTAGNCATGPYTTLSPRQSLAPTPFALFSTTPWSTSGSAISKTNSGGVGIGTNSPASLLHVVSGSAGVSPNSNSLLVVERNASTFINVLCPASQQLGILFGTPTNNADGGVVYNSSGARGMQFRTGGNNTRVTIDSLGNVGIGNLVPLNPLSVAGTTDISGSLGVGTTTPASKLEIVPATDGDGIRMTGSTSPVHSPVLSFNDGPTQRGMLGLAEAAAEFSSDALLGDLILRCNATKLLLQTGTASSGIAIVNNNIGLGTISPTAKLDVHGDINLGSNGEFEAPGGVEKLRILRGRVVGSTGNVPEGTGFTASHTATGQWTVTFTTAFPSPPTITATAFRTGAPAILSVNSFTSASVDIRIYTTAAAAVDADFFLIAMGPR